MLKSGCYFAAFFSASENCEIGWIQVTSSSCVNILLTKWANQPPELCISIIGFHQFFQLGNLLSHEVKPMAKVPAICSKKLRFQIIVARTRDQKG